MLCVICGIFAVICGMPLISPEAMLFPKSWSGLNKPLRLCVQSGNNLLDDRVYRSGKPFDIRHNAVIHGAHRLRRR